MTRSVPKYARRSAASLRQSPKQEGHRGCCRPPSRCRRHWPRRCGQSSAAMPTMRSVDPAAVCHVHKEARPSSCLLPFCRWQRVSHMRPLLIVTAVRGLWPSSHCRAAAAAPTTRSVGPSADCHGRKKSRPSSCATATSNCRQKAGRMPPTEAKATKSCKETILATRRLLPPLSRCGEETGSVTN